MKATELLEIVENYIDDCVRSDLNMDVRFGCDCGCGGDYYEDNPEAWDAMIEAHDNAEKRFVELLDELGIEDNING